MRPAPRVILPLIRAHLTPECAQLSIRNVVFVKDKETNGLEACLRFPQMIKHRATCTITLCSKLRTVELNQFHFNIILGDSTSGIGDAKVSRMQFYFNLLLIKGGITVLVYERPSFLVIFGYNLNPFLKSTNIVKTVYNIMLTSLTFTDLT